MITCPEKLGGEKPVLQLIAVNGVAKARKIVAISGASMNRLFLAFAALSFSTQLFAGTLFPSESDIEKWAYHYYQHQNIDLVPDVVFYFTQRREQPYDDHHFVTGFLAGTFRANPGKVSWLLQKLNDLPDKKFDSVILALWAANLPESRQMVTALVNSRPASGISLNNLPIQPKTTREFIFTGLSCGFHAATGDRTVGPTCWRDLSGLGDISDSGYVQAHHIFAARNSAYVNKILSMPASETSRYLFIYSSLQLLNLDAERKQLGLYMERIRLQKMIGLPPTPVKTVADAITLVQREPKLLDELEVKAFEKTSVVRFASDNETSNHIRNENERWKNEDRYQYKFRGDSIWDYKNGYSLSVLLVVRNTGATSIRQASAVQFFLGQGKEKKPLSLDCDFTDGGVKPGESAVVECGDPGHNHPNGRRSSIEELRAAIKYMKSKSLPLVLHVVPKGRDFFPELDGDPGLSRSYADALGEIKKTNCVQRGSCSEALANAVSQGK